MERQKVVRVLKDPTVNMCSLLCCCRASYPVNKDDENVVQAIAQNTMLFWPNMICGVSPKFIEKEEMIRYRCSPIDLKSIRFDWMLENVAEDDK